MFYDIYIRPTNSAKFDAAASQFFSGVDRMELLDAGATLTTEPISRDLGDGTQIVMAETLVFTAATLKVTRKEYEYLRDVYHNSMIDVLLMDPNSRSIAFAAYRLKNSVFLESQSGDVSLIKFAAKATVPLDSAFTKIHVITDMHTMAMIVGTITNPHGIPIPNASVMYIPDAGSSVAPEDLSDKDGNYLLNVPPGAGVLIITAEGHSFDDIPISTEAGEFLEIDIQEKYT